jgi:hypothetical protein
MKKGSFLMGVVAAALSWMVNKSFLWGVFHFICGSFYVVYWLIVHMPKFL